MKLAGARLCANGRQCSVSGPVTVERAAWRDVAPEEGFGWDAYRQQCVRVTVAEAANLKDLVRAGALRIAYGSPDAQDVCRAWLVSTARAYSVDLSLIDHDTMRPAGFEAAQELNTSDLTLLDAATCTVTHGIGRGLRNWTKRIPQREFEALLA